jgi:hypothetical protein
MPSILHVNKPTLDYAIILVHHSNLASCHKCVHVYMYVCVLCMILCVQGDAARSTRAKTRLVSVHGMFKLLYVLVFYAVWVLKTGLILHPELCFPIAASRCSHAMSSGVAHFALKCKKTNYPPACAVWDTDPRRCPLDWLYCSGVCMQLSVKNVKHGEIQVCMSAQTA